MLADRYREPFRGDLDIEGLVRAVPSHHTIKGAFVASNATFAAPEWGTLEKKLLNPPKGGKYLPFSDYPLADYLRVTDAAARRKFPKVSSREAHRLLSRSTFDVFSQTTLGKVTMSMVTTPNAALLKYQDIFNRMVSGARVVVTEKGPNTLDLEFREYYSTQEAIYGVIEGVILAYRQAPQVVLMAKGRGHFLASTEWSKLP
jgi:uncharacterized protein (TIGR02265 family)